MNSLSSLKKPSTETGKECEHEQKSDGLREFVGREEFSKYFYRTLDHFQEWNEKGDWLTFHHHHYDWWMFPSTCRKKEILLRGEIRFSFLVDEISSRGREFTLPQEFIEELRQNEQFITDLRQGVRWMVKSWGWVKDRLVSFVISHLYSPRILTDASLSPIDRKNKNGRTGLFAYTKLANRCGCSGKRITIDP